MPSTRAGRDGYDGRSRTSGDRRGRMLNSADCGSKTARAPTGSPCRGKPSGDKGLMHDRSSRCRPAYETSRKIRGERRTAPCWKHCQLQRWRHAQRASRKDRRHAKAVRYAKHENQMLERLSIMRRGTYNEIRRAISKLRSSKINAGSISLYTIILPSRRLTSSLLKACPAFNFQSIGISR